MKYKGLIITGTSCAGKTTIVAELTRQQTVFKEVQAYTSRAPRPDDNGHYQYVSKGELESKIQNDEMLTHAEYRQNLYGIAKKEVEKILGMARVPILVIAPDSFQKLKKDYLVIFIDADNEKLYERYKHRNGRTEVEQKYKQSIINDRKYEDKAHYIVKNNHLKATVGLIAFLWDARNSGGGLSQNIIKLMLQCDMLLKNASLDKVKGASYDLTLADEYYYGGEIKRLSEDSQFLKIEPYDYVIVSCAEHVALPKDITANFGLTVGLFCQGIILSNGQQVDPGFRGTLFCLLFNTSNRTVIIKRNSHYATIEFNKMLGFAPEYKGKNQDKVKIIDYIPANVMQGAINELKKEIEALKKESKNMQSVYLGVIAVIFAAISILLVLR